MGDAMNPEAFDRFSEAYRAGLLAAVTASPGDYMLNGRPPVAYAEHVANRILQSISDNPSGVSYDGGGFKRACKSLGIKHTRKAIWQYLGIAP